MREDILEELKIKGLLPNEEFENCSDSLKAWISEALAFRYARVLRVGR